MNNLEYQYAKGRLVGITESLNELSFKNKKEAMKILSDRMLYLSVSLQGITVHDEVAELKARLEKAIVPKYEVGQSLYFAEPDENENTWFRCSEIKITITDRGTSIRYGHDVFGSYGYLEDDLFPSKEEAEQALKSLQQPDKNQGCKEGGDE